MIYLLKTKHWNIVEDYNFDKLLYLLIDRPDEIINNAIFTWKNDKNQECRDYDLPSYINNVNNVSNTIYDGIFWSKNNKLHRENNKPAILLNNGKVEYWVNNNFIKK